MGYILRPCKYVEETREGIIYQWEMCPKSSTLLHTIPEYFIKLLVYPFGISNTKKKNIPAFIRCLIESSLEMYQDNQKDCECEMLQIAFCLVHWRHSTRILVNNVLNLKYKEWTFQMQMSFHRGKRATFRRLIFYYVLNRFDSWFFSWNLKH